MARVNNGDYVRYVRKVTFRQAYTETYVLVFVTFTVS
jgi:hypothetical protein